MGQCSSAGNLDLLKFDERHPSIFVFSAVSLGEPCAPLVLQLGVDLESYHYCRNRILKTTIAVKPSLSVCVIFLSQM